MIDLDEFYKLNPIDRCIRAGQEAQALMQAANVVPPADRENVIAAANAWARVAAPQPGGWRAEDDDGMGPWWYVYEDHKETKVAARGSAMYEAIKDGITAQRRR